MNFEILERELCAFIEKCVKNAKSKGVIIGVSGGLDSALVATLCAKTLKNSVFALIMPSKFSNENNLKDALNLCKSLKITHKIIQIQPILDAFLNACENPCKIRTGNLSARIRMSLLYDYSAKLGYLVVGTSNKSERMLGYGTIYGDLACAFNPIAQLYKSEIFDFARFLKIPKEFIEKAPSADLYEGQSDEKELGFSYAKIDEILRKIENNESLANVDKSLLEMINLRMTQNEFKLKMPPILELKK